MRTNSCRLLCQFAALAFISLILAACAQIGVPTPQTFNAKLATGYVAVTGVRNTAASLLISKAITRADAQNVQKQADTAVEGLKIAEDLHSSGAVGADARLAVTLQVLTALQTYLAAKEKP